MNTGTKIMSLASTALLILSLSGCGATGSGGNATDDMSVSTSEYSDWKTFKVSHMTFKAPKDMELDDTLSTATSCVLKGDNRNILIDILDELPSSSSEFERADVAGGSVYWHILPESGATVLVDAGDKAYQLVYFNFLEDDAREAVEVFLDTVQP